MKHPLPRVNKQTSGRVLPTGKTLQVRLKTPSENYAAFTRGGSGCATTLTSSAGPISSR